MGSGKTTIGRELAQRTERAFGDLDAYIEERSGRSIAALFEAGEAEFRARERECLRELVAPDHPAAPPSPRVVALGGGAFAQPEIRRAIAQAGPSIYLVVPLPTLATRLASPAERQARPLLEVDEWRARLDILLRQREP